MKKMLIVSLMMLLLIGSVFAVKTPSTTIMEQVDGKDVAHITYQNPHQPRVTVIDGVKIIRSGGRMAIIDKSGETTTIVKTRFGSVLTKKPKVIQTPGGGRGGPIIIGRPIHVTEPIAENFSLNQTNELFSCLQKARNEIAISLCVPITVTQTPIMEKQNVSEKKPQDVLVIN